MIVLVLGSLGSSVIEIASAEIYVLGWIWNLLTGTSILNE